MKKILYLPIETIVRELDARLLLAHQAVNRNYYVIIGQKHNVFKTAEILKSGIFFYKSHGADNFPREKKSDKVEFKYISLDEEGLVFVDDNEYLRNSKPNELEHLDIVFTWGSYQRDLLVKENLNLKEKTIPVGNPRFDLLRPEFNILYKHSSEKIQKKRGRYILINTRFAAGNYSRLYGCSYIESRQHQFIKIIGRPATRDEKNFLLREEKYNKKMFNQYVEMIKFISSRFSDINFILRPHPSEDFLNWKNALIGLKNVHVIFKGSAIDWIMGALVVIHTGCTTGIESWALRKPVIAYNPNKEGGIEPPLPNKFGMKIDNINKLYETLTKIVKGELKFEIKKEQLDIARSYIKSITGDYSTTRFLNSLDNMFYIEKIKLREMDKNIFGKLRYVETIRSAVKIKILKILSKYQPLIKRVLGKNFSNYIYGYFKKYPGLFAQFKKFPCLKSDDIKKRLATYDEIFYKKSTNSYLIKKIATDTFLICKK
jgi:surface carbohydrate biosynthesis protein